MSDESELSLAEQSTMSLGGPMSVEGTGPASAPSGPRESERASDDFAAELRDLPPSLRDRYRDASLVGRGGMGTVLRARDARLGRDVAVKLLHRTDGDRPIRFLQEARAQARIRHPNICPVYDAGEVDGQPYIVMQLIEGTPLNRARGSMSLEEKILVVRSVASAVHEAHRVGLIHRDLKPGNILIERQEDGSLKPYVVDFGLAREVREHGQTLTGAVVGTPAYMAPEQARGEIRSLDRRTDVYSLGATLYELIAEKTPFSGDQAWKVLSAIASEDAPPLRGVKPDVPVDLDTIVMKCLEREPGRRYESARALAEDLGRLLDGEPIAARPGSPVRALLRRARKHKLATALAMAALVSGLSLAFVWVKGRRDAAEQARIAQAAGEDVKEMELFLRAAYELPLHDVERERAIVRKKLEAIEARMKGSGAAAQGPGHYALGRGLLALGDPASARDHLEKARAAGYSPPELAYALGHALGELYRREMERAERITSEGERSKREQDLKVTLRDPALSALRGAEGAGLSAPAYVEGLIAYYQGDHERAVERARAASAEAPWLYEAKKLEGDALVAMGSRYGHDAEADPAKMLALYEPAAEAYRLAADVARSDPEVHRAACALSTRVALSEQMAGKSPASSFERATEACDRAARAGPTDPRVIAQRAFLALERAQVSADTGGQDTMSLVDAALQVSEQAVRASPEDPFARYDLARSAYLRESERFMSGLDASADRARAAFEEVLALDPRFSWAIAELGDVLALEAEIVSSKGADPAPSLAAALRQFDLAMAGAPSLTAPLNGKALVFSLTAEDQLAHGRSAARPAADLLGVVADMEARGGQRWLVAYWKARAKRLLAREELEARRDPGPLVTEALAALAALGKETEKDYWLLREIAEIRWIQARRAEDTGVDPSEPLRLARDAARAAVAAKPTHVAPREILARIERVALRWAMRRGNAR